MARKHKVREINTCNQFCGAGGCSSAQGGSALKEKAKTLDDYPFVCPNCN